MTSQKTAANTLSATEIVLSSVCEVLEFVSCVYLPVHTVRYTFTLCLKLPYVVRLQDGSLPETTVPCAMLLQYLRNVEVYSYNWNSRIVYAYDETH